MRRFAFVLALVASGLLVSGGALVAQDEAPPSEGTWVVVDATAAASDRDAAVERVVTEMNFIARPIARRRLTAGLPIHQRVELSTSGDSLKVKVGTLYEVDAPTDGTQRNITDSLGTALRVTQRWRGRTLVQRYVNDDATVTVQLRFSPDGSRMTLATKIEASRLPGDVVFEVRYRRR
ncbi:MAG: hypothetical protein KF901_17965 [Myxococcales bacterium]|nr:hypothetical protein [Myxococcales bacterium]